MVITNNCALIHMFKWNILKMIVDEKKRTSVFVLVTWIINLGLYWIVLLIHVVLSVWKSSWCITLKRYADADKHIRKFRFCNIFRVLYYQAGLKNIFHARCVNLGNCIYFLFRMKWMIREGNLGMYYFDVQTTASSRHVFTYSETIRIQKKYFCKIGKNINHTS